MNDFLLQGSTVFYMLVRKIRFGIDVIRNIICALAWYEGINSEHMVGFLAATKQL